MPNLDHRKASDPVAGHLARGRINRAQYLAAGQFRRHHAAHDPILEKCRRALGVEGMAIIEAMLINNMTARQVAESRGMKGPNWSRYYTRRLQDRLGELARLYGFTNGA